MTFQEWLTAKKIDAAAVTDELKPILEAQWKAEVEAAKDEGEGEGNGTKQGINADAGAPDVAAMINQAVEKATAAATEKATKAIQAAHERESALTEICAEHPDILAKAKKENWSLDKAKLSVIEAEMDHPYIAATGATEGAPDQKQVIEAALCLNAGMKAEEVKTSGYDEKVINAALENRYRGFGLHALMYAVIRAAGRHIAPGIIGDGFIKAAFESDREINASGSAVSNYSLSGLMSNIGNKFILQGFNSVETAWQAIASIASAKDFKTMTSFRLGGDFEYKKLPPGGEIKHATMVEGEYTNRLDTYARMFGIDRRDLINDDMNVFQATARQKLGRGAGLAFNRVFWTEFLDNASFFTVGNGNLIDGILDIDGLTDAEAVFLDLRDENGDPINTVQGAIAVVPTAHGVAAENLFKETTYEYPMSSGPYFKRNPHAGKFKPVKTAYFNDSRIPGYDPDAFYILGDPNTLGIGVIQVVFLNGKRTPTIETSDLDFNALGIQMRALHDFGVEKQEPMCGVKVSGDPEET